MAVLIAFALATLAPPKAPAWTCARRFTVGEAQGSVGQEIEPDGRVSPIRLELSLGTRREDIQDIRWAGPEGASLGTPQNLGAWIETRPADRMLWVRVWGDGRYLGQQPLVDHWLLRHGRGGRKWEVFLHDQPILAALMATEVWELEAVDRFGNSYGRQKLRLPPPSVVRAAYAREAQWLSRVIRTRAEPCMEDKTDDLGSV
jgi:hypothetical protein